MRYILPVGALLMLAGVAMAAQLDRHGMEAGSLDGESSFLSWAFPVALLLGFVMVVVGSKLAKTRLSPDETKLAGVYCLGGSLISVVLLVLISNFHDWTVTLLLPAMAGVFAGAILLSEKGDKG